MGPGCELYTLLELKWRMNQVFTFLNISNFIVGQEGNTRANTMWGI